MIKIIVRTIIMMSMLLLLTSCIPVPDSETLAWQTVTIPEIGTFRIPTDWYVGQRDDFMLITDKPLSEGDYEIYIIGAFPRQYFPHTIFEGVERRGLLHFRGLNNSAMMRLDEYIVNGETEDFFTIWLENEYAMYDNEYIVLVYHLFVWNREVVDEWHVTQIAKTFRGDWEN